MLIAQFETYGGEPCRTCVPPVTTTTLPSTRAARAGGGDSACVGLVAPPAVRCRLFIPTRQLDPNEHAICQTRAVRMRARIVNRNWSY
jgi:hypothetical protein